eukprot:6195133-Pleurochrysis_carterae.AAC.2
MHALDPCVSSYLACKTQPARSLRAAHRASLRVVAHCLNMRGEERAFCTNTHGSTRLHAQSSHGAHTPAPTCT